MAGISTNGHSAIVHITLQAGAKNFAVAQLGPNFLILDQPAALPPCEGSVTLEIDGHRDTFSVLLPAGVREDDDLVTIEKPVPHYAAAA